MFSLPNDLLSQFCVLFTNSSLAVRDLSITEFLDTKQSYDLTVLCFLINHKCFVFSN